MVPPVVDRKFTLLKFPQRVKTTAEMFIEAADQSGAHTLVVLYVDRHGKYGCLSNVGDQASVLQFIDKVRTGFKT